MFLKSVSSFKPVNSRINLKSYNGFSASRQLPYDTVSFSAKKLVVDEKQVEDDILKGNFDKVKADFKSKYPFASDRAFEKYMNKFIKRFEAPFDDLIEGKDIVFDEVVNKKFGGKIFKNKGVTVREVDNIPYYRVTDNLGYDKESNSNLKFERSYYQGEFNGAATYYHELKHNIRYRSIEFFKDSDGEYKYFDFLDSGMLELSDKIDEVQPKFTENIKLKKPDEDVVLPEYLYHITTEENYRSMLSDNRIKTSRGREIAGIYCIEKNNFLNQWNECEAWDGILKECLINNQVIGRNRSDDVVVLKIPMSKLDKDKIKVRTQEDYFYNQEIMERGQFCDLESPKCVQEGYDMATAITNFDRDYSLEYIICEPIDMDGVEVAYIGNVKQDGIEKVLETLKNQ